MTTPPRWTAEELQLGEWLHETLAKELHVEVVGWAPERLARVVERLESARPPEERVVPVVLWTSAFTAFTAAGRYVYVSRRLLERLPDDDAAALIVAHEIAHHDLRHLEHEPDWLPELVRGRGGWLLARLYAAFATSLHGPERECDADRRALEMCIAAGYDPARCLRLFDVFENFALDVGDLDMVFGTDPDSDQELSPDAHWTTKARIWIWQRARGYLPIQDRRAELVRYLAELP